MDDGQNCSGAANDKYPNLKPVDAMWLKYYESCMKRKDIKSNRKQFYRIKKN